MLVGPDVSVWQGDLTWHALELDESRDTFAFAFARATYGLGYPRAGEPDPWFANNWRQMRERGLVRGAYHYALTHLDPVAQADFFLRTVGELHHRDLPLALDIEETSPLTGEALLDWLRRWIEAVHRGTGVKPMVYTYVSWLESYLRPVMRTTWDCPLWIADVPWVTPPPTAPSASEGPGNLHPWPEWTFWQYTDKGTLRGHTGDVDLSVFHSEDMAVLEAFTVGGSGFHRPDHHQPQPDHHQPQPDHHQPQPVHHHGAHPAWPGLLRRDHHGPHVRMWQERMRERGFVELVVDEHYGPRCAECCRWLQLYVGLPDTGEVNHETWVATFTAP